ncbi:MAG: UDP-N-acetylmuramate dehydrogenase [Oscillospiraceae bacterium]|nr:UDP-N-acetylmuramate dehydrogenase [Oscillospiraceae bacterium]
MSEHFFSALEKIGEKHKCVCERGFVLAPLTTMQIGGECGLFIEPNTEECLCEVLNVCRSEGIPFFLLGKGSNLLIKRFSGVVIKIGSALGGFEFDGERVTAGAGGSLAALCSAAANEGLSGMECLYGIPGSVGGALYMNAGAYGAEMKDIVRSARCIDTSGNIVELTAVEMELSYRHSAFSENGYCILSVTMELKRGNTDEIKAKMSEVVQKRRDKQPLEYPSCGSTFKRPDGYFAAALIEECGLKGHSVGGAQVSEKHSGFVINRGGATFEDVMALVNYIKKVVREQKGVELECEMLIVDK